VAENTTDSFIAPWLAFALFGLPGAVAYRAINTLDSMIGYHGKYEYLGKASARLDDLVNLIPARLSALLLVVGSAILPGQKVSRAWRIMWRDHRRTESPNAGWTMSGMAGALGVALEKVGHYRLGDPMRPLEPQDITRAIQTMYLIACLGLSVALGVTFLRYAAF
jgi:adenosylcobinamide-phosphate synthase